jgi:hypothetical protein
MQYFRGGVSQERKIGQMKNTTLMIWVMYDDVHIMIGDGEVAAVVVLSPPSSN